jgi:hypothetical protein
MVLLSKRGLPILKGKRKKWKRGKRKEGIIGQLSFAISHLSFKNASRRFTQIRADQNDIKEGHLIRLSLISDRVLSAWICGGFLK